MEVWHHVSLHVRLETESTEEVWGRAVSRQLRERDAGLIESQRRVGELEEEVATAVRFHANNPCAILHRLVGSDRFRRPRIAGIWRCCCGGRTMTTTAVKR